MKKFLLFIVSITLVFTACKKDSEKEPLYRCISSISSINQVMSDTSTYHFQGNHITSSKHGDLRSEYFYQGDSVFIDVYGFYNNEEHHLGRVVNKYMNNKIVYKTQYQDKECTIVDKKDVFSYSGEELIRYEKYEYMYDSLVLRLFTDYEYEGGLLKTTSCHYWDLPTAKFLLTKTELKYTGSAISEKVIYKERSYYPLALFEKHLLQYDENRLIKKNILSYINGYEQLYGLWEYTYDNNGNNTSIVITDSLGNITQESNRTYEAGEYKHGEYYEGLYNFYLEYPLP